MQLHQLVSALIIGLASAQTFTNCDPLKSGNCKPNPALGSGLVANFKDGENSEFKAVSAKQQISYSQDGAEFTIQKSGDNPTLESNFYIMFGRVETMLKAAPGTGIVSSFVLQSDDLDEIDLEWLGGDTTQVQTNYFSKGDTSTYTRGNFHPVDSPQQKFHNYTVDWSSDRTVWYLDNEVIRTLDANSQDGYPQTPMKIRVGSWAGGDTSLNQPGTVQWAGGETKFGDGPFKLDVESIKVQDYSTGKEYKYGDRSGKWSSIQAVDGKVNGNEDGSNKHDNVHVQSSSSASASASPSTSPASHAVSSAKTPASSSHNSTTHSQAPPSTRSHGSAKPTHHSQAPSSQPHVSSSRPKPLPTSSLLHLSNSVTQQSGSRSANQNNNNMASGSAGSGIMQGGAGVNHATSAAVFGAFGLLLSLV